MNSKISRYLVGPFAPPRVEQSCAHTPKATESMDMNSDISRYLVGPFAPPHVEKSCIHTPKATENEAESQSQLERRAGIFLSSSQNRRSQRIRRIQTKRITNLMDITGLLNPVVETDTCPEPCDTQKPRFPCPRCGKSFVWERSVPEHIRAVHRKLKGFKCKFKDCGKRYGHACTLVQHTKTHLDVPAVSALSSNRNVSRSGRNRHAALERGNASNSNVVKTEEKPS
jgi:uncharacterized Zn-finger protein